MTHEEFNNLKYGDMVIGERQSKFLIIEKIIYKDRLMYVAEHQGCDRNIAVLINPLNFNRLKNRISLGGYHEGKS